jgi:outer membrane protein OmpA-like peptidoglycan-associated protein
MKGIVTIFLWGVLFLNGATSLAQVKVDVEKKLTKETNQRANNKTDELIDKGFDKVEDGINNLFKKKDKNSEKENPGATDEVQQQEASPSKIKTSDVEPQDLIPETKKPTLTWAKYDFVPGTEIIFEDNLEGEQNGEFPSKWDLKAGTVEIANLDGENVIWFRKTDSKIIPLIKAINFLPEEFTIEFDYQVFNPTQHHYQLYFNGEDGKRALSWIDFSGRGLGYHTTHGNTTINGEINAKFTPGWKHMAISFNKRALKVYVDDQRVLNIPNIDEAFKSFSIKSGLGTSATEAKSTIKNFRIAKGAVPLYDKFLTEGKFVTTGIKFDVNKATIKPESMGTINYVVKMMTDHPELKFSVEGHTDSDGEDAMNQKLSEARAKAVMEAMVKLGISADRLTSKGHGESKPMAGNDTPEGKAQNRRVEFVKF